MTFIVHKYTLVQHHLRNILKKVNPLGSITSNESTFLQYVIYFKFANKLHRELLHVPLKVNLTGSVHSCRTMSIMVLEFFFKYHSFFINNGVGGQSSRAAA